MPTTSNFGWTTPADTDLVKDGAAAIRTLGNGIDTSFLDLKGGTTGQNLRKASNTDLDFTFAGDATNTVVDAAGDLLYGTAADTLGRLAIGTAGQVLKVNSGATAPEWAAATTAFVGCALYKNASQTISNDATTAITFPQETFDTDGFHSTVTNTSRITIPTGQGGYYIVTATCLWADNSSGHRRWLLYKNGAVDFGVRTGASSAGGVGLTFAAVRNYAAGDYIEMFGYQNSGGNLDLFGDSFLGASFCVSKVG